jgi:ubiquinone/menaquinone biosynthesis C-methylase UbiE
MAEHVIDAEQFSFTPFTRHPFFTEVNRWIVKRVIGPSRRVIVDLGCGPGAVTQLIVDQLGRRHDAKVIGVDPCAAALDRARAAVSTRIAQFVEGSAELLSHVVPSASADAVVFCNAIHLIPDKARVVAEIRRVLRRGGVLAFNTTFFNGAYVDGTSGFWRRWVVRAVQVLRERGIEVRHAAKATARAFLTPDEYAALCVQEGFNRPTIELLRVELPPESLDDIGHFSLFIEGALPGVPLAEGAAALREGLQRALDETGLTGVPRNWLECVAVARA